jgi:hypothetical protein
MASYRPTFETPTVSLSTPHVPAKITADATTALVKELHEKYPHHTTGVFERFVSIPYRRITILSDQIPALLCQFELVGMLIIRRNYNQYYIGGNEHELNVDMIYISANHTITQEYLCDLTMALRACSDMVEKIAIPAEDTLVRPFVYSPRDLLAYFILLDKTQWPVHWSKETQSMTPRIMRPRDYAYAWPSDIMCTLYMYKSAAMIHQAKPTHPVSIRWYSPTTPFDPNATYVYYISNEMEATLQTNLQRERDLTQTQIALQTFGLTTQPQ